MYNADGLTGLEIWARESIKANSPEFDLRYWARRGEFGTAFCLGGKAVTDAGYRIVWPRYGRSLWGETSSLCASPGSTDEVEISEVARKLLGLSWEEGALLFMADLQAEAMRASDVDRPEEVDTCEVEEAICLECLAVLVLRAREGEPNMLRREVAAWEDRWVKAHWSDLQGCAWDT